MVEVILVNGRSVLPAEELQMPAASNGSMQVTVQI